MFSSFAASVGLRSVCAWYESKYLLYLKRRRLTTFDLRASVIASILNLWAILPWNFVEIESWQKQLAIASSTSIRHDGVDGHHFAVSVILVTIWGLLHHYMPVANRCSFIRTEFNVQMGEVPFIRLGLRLENVHVYITPKFLCQISGGRFKT